MCPVTSGSRFPVISLLLFVLTLPASLWAQGGGGAVASQPLFRVVRSVAGSKGEQQNGRYVIDDPRDVFYVPADKEVIVYFEWEGPLGQHNFEGQWKNPEGKAVVISDFTYNATTKRFGGYWTLELSNSIEPGMWSLEAHVDGEVTGTHSFQIVAAPKPASDQPTRHQRAPAEIYKMALAATVTVERLDAKGQRSGIGSGFFLADDLVLTAFQVINGASRLRILLPDGQPLDVDQVAAWNRWQDWALLKVDARATGKLKRAPAGSWAVGDRCFTLDVPAEGNRVIVDEAIVGTHTFPNAGDRLNLPSLPRSPALGGPVLNEYGEVVGVLGGSVLPGLVVSSPFDPGAGLSPIREGSLATPINLIPATPTAGSGRTLDQLAGEFVPPLVKQPNLLYGILSLPVKRAKGQLPTTPENKTEFSKRDSAIQLQLVWNPTEKGNAEVTLRVYDMNNTVVVTSPMTRVKFNPGRFLMSTWNLNLAPLHPGTYRVDVMQNSDPIWRAYFRLME